MLEKFERYLGLSGRKASSPTTGASQSGVVRRPPASSERPLDLESFATLQMRVVLMGIFDAAPDERLGVSWPSWCVGSLISTTRWEALTWIKARPPEW